MSETAGAASAVVAGGNTEEVNRRLARCFSSSGSPSRLRNTDLASPPTEPRWRHVSVLVVAAAADVVGVVGAGDDRRI